MKKYKSLLIQFFNGSININLHKFKEKSIEIFNNRNYNFLYDSIFINNLYNRLKNTVNFSDNIIFKHNLTISNKPFLKSFSIDNQIKANQIIKYNANNLFYGKLIK